MSDATQLKAVQTLCVQLAKHIIDTPFLGISSAAIQLARDVVKAHDNSTKWSDILHHVEGGE